MGIGNSKNKIDVLDSEGRLSRAQFYLHCPIGVSRFGVVYKAEHRMTRELYALKQMKKSEIFNQRGLDSVLNELEILSRIRHSFVANVYFAFQDTEHLYLASELVPGGDLGYYLRKRKFKENQAKFIIASIIVALEYLHNNNLIHRNVNPSNILLDKKGYVKISDFVLAREWEKNNASETSGTPGYMAPEIMGRQNYNFSSDYFALGVIGYQFMLRKMPYTGVTRKEVIEQIKKKQIQLKKHEIPEGWSLESADFINKGLQRKPECRLGLNGAIELKQHVWLRDFDWQGLAEKEIPSHFTPKLNLLK